jgi:hypothetical protein
MKIGAFFAALLLVGPGVCVQATAAPMPPAVEHGQPVARTVQLAALPPGTEPDGTAPAGEGAPPASAPRTTAKRPASAKKGNAAAGKPGAARHKTPPKGQARTPVVSKPAGASRTPVAARCPSGTKKASTGRCVPRSAAPKRA